MHPAKLFLLSFIFICSSLITAHANQVVQSKNIFVTNITSTIKKPNNVVITVSSRHTLQLSTKRRITSPRFILTNLPKQESKSLPQSPVNSSPSNFYTSMMIFNDKLHQGLSFLKSLELKMFIALFKTPLVP
jgi:hypothetical protein